MATTEPERKAEKVADARATIGTDRYHVDVQVERHRLAADEPADHGGADTGPSPFGLLVSGLGAWTAITLRMYAEGKRCPGGGGRPAGLHRLALRAWPRQRADVTAAAERPLGSWGSQSEAVTRLVLGTVGARMATGRAH